MASTTNFSAGGMFNEANVRAKGISARLQQNRFGRAFKVGAGEAFGFHFEKGIGIPGKNFQRTSKGMYTNMGFMGLRETVPAFKKQVMSAVPAEMGKPSFIKGIRAAPGKTAKASVGFIGKTAWRGGPGLAGTVAFAVEGYHKEGVWGAAKGIGESVAWDAGLRMARAVVGTKALIATVGVVAVGYGAYALGEAGREHGRKLRDTEMGGGEQVLEALGSHGAATMRQRAVMALNNTHLNGRMAMGNEAAIMHKPFL